METLHYNPAEFSLYLGELTNLCWGLVPSYPRLREHAFWTTIGLQFPQTLNTAPPLPTSDYEHKNINSAQMQNKQNILIFHCMS